MRKLFCTALYTGMGFIQNEKHAKKKKFNLKVYTEIISALPAVIAQRQYSTVSNFFYVCLCING